jgi:3-oxoacyl-[acyl-carrier protein] reductase
LAKETGLADKVVIVTGGATGIGRATALRFGEDGARVAVWDLDEEGGGSVLAEIQSKDREAVFQKVDVSSSPAVDEAVQRVKQRWGRIDVLVNNAGILRDAQIVKWKDGQAVSRMSDEVFDEVLSVNLKGVFHCTRAVVPHMIEGGGGVVLSASSVVAFNSNFGQTNYSAAKAGVINMTRTWARELGRYNIRVNAVAPGFIDTRMSRSVPEKVLQGVISHTPLRRLGDVEEVAEAYVWLASDRASFVHGAVLSVDGGLVMGT